MHIKRILVYGVGINDADYMVYTYKIGDDKRRQAWHCPFYLVWREMLCRCYSAKYQAKKPTYIGCSVDKEWLSFMSFKSWMSDQDWQGNQLDKDILLPGNKIYSPEYCVFISGKLNSFMVDRAAARGDCPIGVSFNHDTKKFLARCSNPFIGKQEYLGQFQSKLEAHESWRAKKHEHACRYADQQTDPRIAQALRARYLTGGVQ